jgi:hypothetical protein
MSPRMWNYGDRVVHANKPEWGPGVVSGAQKIVHEGTPCQRLTVRFDRAGIKTLNTALANLIPADEAPSLPPEAADADPHADTSDGGKAGGAGWLGRLSAANPQDAMTRLPEAATDPFAGMAARLKATLALYRYTDTGSGLVDWGAVQSGLKDPMTRFNRHELEQMFRRFSAARDEHLKRLVLEMKRRDPAGLAEAARGAPPGAQQALRRIDGGR